MEHVKSVLVVVMILIIGICVSGCQSEQEKSETMAQAEAQAQVVTQAVPETQEQVESETQAQAEPETQVQAEAEMQAQTEQEVQSAIEAYMGDVPFSYTAPITQQIQEQDAERKAEGLTQESQTEYSFSIQIPNLEELSIEELDFIPPTLDYNKPSYDSLKDYVLDLRQLVESAALTYIETNTIPAWREAFLNLTLSENEQGDLLAEVDGLADERSGSANSSATELLQEMAYNLFDNSEAMQELVEIGSIVIDHRSDLLYELFDNYGEFVPEAQIRGISPGADGNYTMEIAYPDPAALFPTLAEGIIAQYDEPVFDPVSYSFASDGIPKGSFGSVPDISTTVTVSGQTDNSDNGGFSDCHIDQTSINKIVSQIKDSASSSEQAITDSVIQITPQTIPSSGVLEGSNSGNLCIVHTSGNVDNYYLRFFSHDGTSSLSQHGGLVLGVFIRGGVDYEFYLPDGQYVLEYCTGDEWYGTKYLFGPQGDYNRMDSIIDSLYGYYNELTLYSVADGNTSISDLPYSPG